MEPRCLRRPNLERIKKYILNVKIIWKLQAQGVFFEPRCLRRRILGQVYDISPAS